MMLDMPAPGAPATRKAPAASTGGSAVATTTAQVMSGSSTSCPRVPASTARGAEATRRKSAGVSSSPMIIIRKKRTSEPTQSVAVITAERLA